MIKENNEGQLIVISGPSGVGKGSVCKEIIKCRENIWLSISHTTREKRGKEIEGVNYYFVSREDFEEKIKNNEFLEYAIVFNNNYYGTNKAEVLDKLSQGIDVILEIETIGAAIIKELYKDAILIFILPPSMKELKRRLIGRKTEDEKEIIDRFKMADQEISKINNYDYVVVNDLEEETVTKINAIITAEKCRVDRIEEVYLNAEEDVNQILMKDEI